MTDKFLVITHVNHAVSKGKYFAYGPYVNEMNLWFGSVEKVEVVAPLSGNDSLIDQSYEHHAINFKKVPSVNLLGLKNTFLALIMTPIIGGRIIKAMKRADHIHLRCPGNIGLVACFIQIFFPKKPKTAKYAGNWDPEAKQPWSYNLQKKILNNTFLTRNMKVLVYGDWPGQSKNILPFFTASFSEKEKIKVEKKFASPFIFLFVGGLVEGKRPLFAIQLVEKLMSRGIAVKLELYGDGNSRKELREYVEQKNLDPFITFHGNRKLEELKEAYINSHFLILASKSEGWPKAVAEAMFFGCIPVASAVSCVPWMLNYGERGIIIHTKENRKENKEKRLVEKSGEKKVESLDVLNDTVQKILELIKDPEEMRRMSMAAQGWSQQFTLDRFEKEIKKLLIRKEG